MPDSIEICASMQLEQAQGCVDPQARAQLDRLRQTTAALSRAEGQMQEDAPATAQAADELAIAGQIDKQVTSAPATTILLCFCRNTRTLHVAAEWMGS